MITSWIVDKDNALQNVLDSQMYVLDHKHDKQ